MKLTIERDGKIIWFRDKAKNEGMACTGYIKDGTQREMISVLEEALLQARMEQLCWNDANRVADIGATTT